MGSIIGSIIGNEVSGDERRAARNSMSEAVGAFRDLKIPTKEEMEIALENLKLQGVLSPEMEEAIRQDPSLLNEFSADPNLRAAQMGALEQLKTLGKTGLDATDRAAYNQVRLEAARDAKAQQEAILQNMQARGMAGSGQELAAKLAASQNAAQIQSAQGDKLAADALQRRLQAIAQAGQLGSNLESQQFGEAAAKASAQDAINRFNTANQQAVQERNIANRNTAQARNLAEKQRVSDVNVGLRNQQEIHNKALPGQIYQMGLQRAAGLAGQLGNQANMQTAEGQRLANMWSGIGKSVDQGALAIMGMPSGGGGISPAEATAGADAAMAKGYYGFGATPSYMQFSEGGVVPGEAPYHGDHPKNDVIDAKLSPGEVVVPKSVVEQGPKEAGQFVHDAKKQHHKQQVAKASLSVLSQILKNLEEK